MGPVCPASIVWGNKNVVILNHSGARTIYLLFCVHQGTEYK